jgi:Chaperone of endosialidase
MLLNTSGFLNTALGTDALFFNDSGNGNSAVGVFALYNNIDGNDNNAFGRSALVENIHSRGNTAIGTEALRSNDVTGNGTANFNTAVGAGALVSNTDGELNTAVGFVALGGNDTGVSNTAVGSHALQSNSGAPPLGSQNTAVGSSALTSNTDGTSNTAIGASALEDNTSGRSNVASGVAAMVNNVSGSGNTVVGDSAGINIIGGDANIYVGQDVSGPADESLTTRIGVFQDHCYIDGIYGSTYGPADLPVRIGNDGKLGTMASSARFKKDIKSMDKASESILALKPVTFRYKNDAMGTPQFGLVAEEVAKVNPDLVVLDRDGKPYTVRYEEVNAMLLNEFLKEHRKVEELTKDFQATVAQLTARLDEQASQIQKVSAQLEASKPAPQVVNNP